MVQAILEACEIRNLHANTLVLDRDRLDSTILVHIPKQYCIWYDVHEVMNDVSGESVSFQHEPHTSWVEILTDNLDLSIGFHSYSIKLVHRHNQIKYFWMCFGYTAQSSNPETPYIYMNRDVPVESDGDEDLNYPEDEDGSNIFQ